ncbi:MAG: DUF1566 domain-containing protein, partial [Deltaproteobacteria bacterium]|nr:DUF1566 domain-containing protein [Deltaproteobacteria bacterium]
MKLRYMLTVLYCMTGLLSASLVVGDELANPPNPASPSAAQTSRSDAPPYPAQLPQTGQTACYNKDGGTIDCANTGQDGDVRAGIPWPNPRITDNNDGTITDNLTGLVWIKDPGGLTTWFLGPSGNNGATWPSALLLASQLSSGSCCGLSDGSKAGDWRLPNINELRSLIDYSASWPALPTSISSYFCSVFCDPGYYWTSTVAQDNQAYAWAMELRDGITMDFDRYTSTQHVWLVRDGSGKHTISLPKTGQTQSFNPGDDGARQKGVAWPNNRFTNNGNGTVTDNLTGLIWLKDAGCFDGPYVNGYKIGPTWTDAMVAANGLGNKDCGLSDGSKAGDWRLPNISELKSLIDHSQCFPALPTDNPFTGVQWDRYWSSTADANQPSASRIIDLGVTTIGFDFKFVDMDRHHFVWPVRGGQIGASGPVIVSFSPKNGGSGTIITIKGTNLQDASAVTFGGKASKS